MKLLRKLLVLVLVLGGIWGLNKFKIQSSKFKIEETRNEKQNPSVKFAVMSDIHSDWENFRKALGKVRPASVRLSRTSARQGFVIITGDLTTLGKKSELIEAKKILDESGLKYFVIPGNHDIWWGREYKQNVWGEVFGDSFQSFKIEGNKFILVNNSDGVGGFEGFGGFGQKDWLEKETEECLRVYCLVFVHIPLNHPSSLHIMGEDNPRVASEAGKLIDILVKNEIKEIFAGHLHFSSSYELDGLKTTIVGAVTSERNFQSPKFLEVEINKDSLNKREFFVD